MMKITKKTVFLLFGAILLIVLLFFTFQFKNSNGKEERIAVETFQTETGGWGYKIVTGNKILIKQDVIPAIENNIPFQSEKDAKKTAALVIKKMKQNSFPTITVEELNELSVITGKQNKE